jgi:hypothetical protein
MSPAAFGVGRPGRPGRCQRRRRQRQRRAATTPPAAAAQLSTKEVQPQPAEREREGRERERDWLSPPTASQVKRAERANHGELLKQGRLQRQLEAVGAAAAAERKLGGRVSE